MKLLMTKTIIPKHYSSIGANVFQIPEGGGLRSTKFNTKTMFNRSENVHITTKAPSFGYVLL